MGFSRLLAKGWVVLCLFAGAHAVAAAIRSQQSLSLALTGIAICVALFGAMGLLFVGGFGVSGRDGGTPILSRLKPHHLMPGFNEIVFIIFVVLSFVNQVSFAPLRLSGIVVNSLKSAIGFAVPGQRALMAGLAPCALDGGRLFASALSWLLAAVFFASALSRVRLSAGLSRLERHAHPAVLGPAIRAAVLGVAALVGIQLLYFGTLFSWLHCGELGGLPGTVLVGLAPLLLSYLVVAAIVALLAMNKDM